MGGRLKAFGSSGAPRLIGRALLRDHAEDGRQGNRDGDDRVFHANSPERSRASEGCEWRVTAWTVRTPVACWMVIVSRTRLVYRARTSRASCHRRGSAAPPGASA